MKNMTRYISHQVFARMILFTVLILLTYLATTGQAKPIVMSVGCFELGEFQSCCDLNGIDFDSSISCGGGAWVCKYFLKIGEVFYQEIIHAPGSGWTVDSFNSVPKNAYCKFYMLDLNGPTGGCGTALSHCDYFEDPVMSYCESKVVDEDSVFCLGGA